MRHIRNVGVAAGNCSSPNAYRGCRPGIVYRQVTSLDRIIQPLSIVVNPYPHGPSPQIVTIAPCTQDVLEPTVHTLTELRHVHLPLDASFVERLSLERFVALRSATVCSLWGRDRSVVACMPAGLRELTLVGVPTPEPASQGPAAQTCAAVATGLNESYPVPMGCGITDSPALLVLSAVCVMTPGKAVKAIRSRPPVWMTLRATASWVRVSDAVHRMSQPVILGRD